MVVGASAAMTRRRTRTSARRWRWRGDDLVACGIPGAVVSDSGHHRLACLRDESVECEDSRAVGAQRSHVVDAGAGG